jgi:outer membrane protein TolC
VQAVNPSAFNAIAPIRVQWDQARATYLQAQQAELVARANFDRANTALLNVMSAATQHLPTAPMPVVIAQPVQGQPVPAQPPRP